MGKLVADVRELEIRRTQDREEIFFFWKFERHLSTENQCSCARSTESVADKS
jgi:hypothetical protein